MIKRNNEEDEDNVMSNIRGMRRTRRRMGRRRWEAWEEGEEKEEGEAWEEGQEGQKGPTIRTLDFASTNACLPARPFQDLANIRDGSLSAAG